MVAFMANIKAIEITGITEIGETKLLDVARTGDAARFSPRLAQSREQQGGKNCDDRYRKMEKNSYLLQSYRLKQTSCEINKFCN